jgi:hypothetical protein
MVGFGFTVMVNVCGVPVHPAWLGVTVIVPVIGFAVAFAAVNTEMFPVPLAVSPMLGFELTHAKEAPAVPEKATAEALAPVQSV